MSFEEGDAISLGDALPDALSPGGRLSLTLTLTLALALPLPLFLPLPLPLPLPLT